MLDSIQLGGARLQGQTCQVLNAPVLIRTEPDCWNKPLDDPGLSTWQVSYGSAMIRRQ